MSKSYNYQPAGTLTVTTTGNIAQLDPQGNSLILMNNASLSTIQGIKAGYPGQQITIQSVGAGEVDLPHQNGSASAIDRLVNFVTSGVTPLAPGVGTATYKYSDLSNRWKLISHEQGAWIIPAFSAGDWTGGVMTVTVQSTDVLTDRFRINGKTIQYQFFIHGITIGGSAANAILRAIPYGYTVSTATSKSGSGGPMRVLDNGTYRMGFAFVFNPGGANPSSIFFTIFDLTNYSNPSTDNTDLFGNVEFEVD